MARDKGLVEPNPESKKRLHQWGREVALLYRIPQIHEQEDILATMVDDPPAC